MGYAIPSAVAAKIVHPHRPVVAVCHDGGFAMTIDGLKTVLENDVPIVTLILNNHALGWSKHSRGDFATRFDDFDHAAIARAMGCYGSKVTDPDMLGAALDEALADGLPTVIYVETSLTTVYSDVVSPLAQ
ncbi:Thiamine pyrophosphate enzyme, C-terminal TPP binding domain [Methylobacterium sp. ap11]|uniref:thiamine pyrophosphate-dependent enzyme n=1 Tax=Methylobacterium sp. ap11 TaxID=1761799 RepID=UPI0008CD75C0|nr:thiamine pyrophosphate-dependent enzyme [Methylobacterium sp. ap11]SEP28473.1 Thiamine pyrophosphate enzyme, C-terminal TPP binding domain [Methylobacterium sp. ap11]